MVVDGQELRRFFGTCLLALAALMIALRPREARVVMQTGNVEVTLAHHASSAETELNGAPPVTMPILPKTKRKPQIPTPTPTEEPTPEPTPLPDPPPAPRPHNNDNSQRYRKYSESRGQVQNPPPVPPSGGIFVVQNGVKVGEPQNAANAAFADLIHTRCGCSQPLLFGTGDEGYQWNAATNQVAYPISIGADVSAPTPAPTKAPPTASPDEVDDATAPIAGAAKPAAIVERRYIKTAGAIRRFVEAPTYVYNAKKKKFDVEPTPPAADGDASPSPPFQKRVLFIGDSLMHQLFNAALTMVIGDNIVPQDELARIHLQHPDTRSLLYTFPSDVNGSHPIYIRFENAPYFSRDSHNVELSGATDFKPTHVIFDRGPWDLVHGVPHDPSIPLREITQVLVHMRRVFGPATRLIYYAMPLIYSSITGASVPGHPNFACTMQHDAEVMRDAMYCAIRRANTMHAGMNVELFDIRELSMLFGPQQYFGRDGLHPGNTILMFAVALLAQTMALPPTPWATRVEAMSDGRARKQLPERLPLVGYIPPPLDTAKCPVAQTPLPPEALLTLRRGVKCVKTFHISQSQVGLPEMRSGFAQAGVDVARSSASLALTLVGDAHGVVAAVEDSAGTGGTPASTSVSRQLDNHKLLRLTSLCTWVLNNWIFHLRSVAMLQRRTLEELDVYFKTNFGDGGDDGKPGTPVLPWLREFYTVGRACLAVTMSIDQQAADTVLWPAAIRAELQCAQVWRICAFFRPGSRPIRVDDAVALKCYISTVAKR